MKISFKGDYALKTILDLSLNYGKGLAKIADISKRRDIPLKYLEQILLQLKGAGYVNSHRGPAGGYYLAKEPFKITLGEIIRLMEGYTSPISCVSESCKLKDRCKDETRCAFRPIWSNIRDMVNEVVDRVNFEDMCKRNNAIEKNKITTYEI